MTKDEALKMAIEFMETLTIDVGIKTWNEKHRKGAINACKEALEQPAQEPVTWGNPTYNYAVHHKVEPSWQGLSNDEIWDIANFLGKNKEWDYPVMFAKTIEKALKEKNTGLYFK